MGSIKSLLFSPFSYENTEIAAINNKLEEISQAVKAINSHLELLESTNDQYLTSIHQKDKVIEQIQAFLDEKTFLFSFNGRELENRSDVIRQSKPIKKEEKHAILKERIQKRKHSEKFEKARFSVKEGRVFENLDELLTKNEQEEDPNDLKLPE